MLPFWQLIAGRLWCAQQNEFLEVFKVLVQGALRVPCSDASISCSASSVPASVSFPQNRCSICEGPARRAARACCTEMRWPDRSFRHHLSCPLSSSSLHCALQNFEKPDEDEVAQTAKETEAALLAVVTTKLHAQQPKQLPKQPGDAQYIKYTPAQQGKQYNSGAGQRIIKMQDMPVDPMEPPKFRCTALTCRGMSVTCAGESRWRRGISMWQAVLMAEEDALL